MINSNISSSRNVNTIKESNSGLKNRTESKGFDFNELITKSISLTSSSKTLSPTELSGIRKNDKLNTEITNKNLHKSSKTSNRNDSKDVDDTLIDGIIDEIKEKIKSEFGISDKDLELALAHLGITMQDLLKPNNLTNFICEITGTENALTLLTNSDLSDQLKSIMDFVNAKMNGLAVNLDISLQDLKNIIEKSTTSEQQQNSISKDMVDESQVIETIINENMSDDNNQTQNFALDVKNDESARTNSSEQSESDLQSIIESKLTISKEQNNSGSMSKNSEDTSGNDQKFTNITNNLTQSIQEAFDKIIVKESSTIDTVDIIRQIVEAAKVTVNQQVSSMEIQLNPQNLGKINLSVIAKDGLITAQIIVENEAVKKAIENQLSVLKENFNNQGIKVEAVEVTIASHSFESNEHLNKGDSNQDENNKKAKNSIKLDGLDDLQEDELSIEERRVMQMLKNNNSNVEYSA